MSTDIDPRKIAITLWPKAVFACHADPRFSYCFFAPSSFREDPSSHELVVVMHGSSRNSVAYRDAFIKFATEHRCVILAPLFPIGVLGDDYPDGYKYLIEGNIRYDKVVMSMVDEFGKKLGHTFEKFILCGFSGGAHFTHRFFYLHPERLNAVAIGAPGAVTLLDETTAYWLGTRDIEARFGKCLNMAAMRKVAVYLFVGELDTQPFVYPPGVAHAVAGMERLGKNRVERIETLRKNLEIHGISATLKTIPGIAHEGIRMMASLQEVIAAHLAAKHGSRHA